MYLTNYSTAKDLGDKVVMYTDGSCAPVNPNGFASCGIVILTSNGIYRANKFLGVGRGYSSFRAEFAGLKMGLETLKSLDLDERDVEVFVDLLMVFDFLFDKRTPERKRDYYKELKEVQKLIKQFPHLRIQQVGSASNLADIQAKSALKPYQNTAKWNQLKEGYVYGR